MIGRSELTRKSRRVHARAMSKLTTGTYVRQLRVDRGLTRAALADRAGVSESTLARLELSDQEPTVRLLRRIAAVLEVEVSDVLNPPAPEQVSS